MKYDFSTILKRQGRDAIALDALGGPGVPGLPREGFDAIPMWIADMNFATAPSVCRAMSERLAHPVFGYFDPSEDYYRAVIQWHRERKGTTDLTAEAIGYENGVLGGVVSAVTAFTAPGDAVLVHSPTYVGFTKSLTNCGRRLVHSPLVLDAEGVWRMDYGDMDAKLKAEKIHLAIFCSPHNPCGRVWERWEIEKAMEVYKNNDCVVISDEIWSDILLDGNTHVPTQSVSDDAKNRTIALYAPSKTFNLAGLVGSYHVIYNGYLRDRVRAQAGKCHYNQMNVLSMHALIGAYSAEGAEWVDELCQVLSKNVDDACRYIAENFPGVRVSKPQGTYMLFLDCTQWCEAHKKTIDDVLQAGWDVGVAWQDGRKFNGTCAIRANLALPHDRLMEALERMKTYVFV